MTNERKNQISVDIQHPEDICSECGGKNVTWFAGGELWNSVNGSPNGIMCPSCFLSKAHQMYPDAIFEISIK